MARSLGIGTYTLAWNIGIGESVPTRAFGPLEVLETARRYGFDTVQFCENLPLDALSPDDLRRVEESGLRIEVGCRSLEPGRIERNLALARRFGSPFLRVVIDDRGYEPSFDEALADLRRLLPISADYGVRLALENHDRFRATDFLHLIEACDGQIGIVLDTANSLGCLEGPLEVARVLGPHVLCVHIKDVRAVRESHNLGFRVFGTPAGEGAVPCREVVREVARHGQDLSIILELWPAPQGSPDETASFELAQLEASVAFMHSLRDDEA